MEVKTYTENGTDAKIGLAVVENFNTRCFHLCVHVVFNKGQQNQQLISGKAFTKENMVKELPRIQDEFDSAVKEFLKSGSQLPMFEILTYYKFRPARNENVWERTLH